MISETDDHGLAPLTHPLPVAGLTREHETRVSFKAADDVLEALAGWLGVDAVRDVKVAAVLAPEGKDRWHVTGKVTATVTQSCVVTLDPVRNRLEARIDRHLAPAPEVKLPAEHELRAEELDAPDPLGDSIDPGALAAEVLLLEIDPWPRAPGVGPADRLVSPPGAEPLTDEAIRPFAKLAALKEKLERGS